MWQGRRPQHCQAVVAIRAPPTGDCKCHVFTLSPLILRDDNAATGQPATGWWPGRWPQHWQAWLGRRPQHWQAVAAFRVAWGAHSRSSLLVIIIFIIIQNILVGGLLWGSHLMMWIKMLLIILFSMPSVKHLPQRASVEHSLSTLSGFDLWLTNLKKQSPQTGQAVGGIEIDLQPAYSVSHPVEAS